MKLYAKITSERATKGQGGNDYLDIDLTVGDAKNQISFARFTLRYSDELPEEEGSGWVLYDENDEPIKWLADEKSKSCRHDYDYFGKCCNCGIWKHKEKNNCGCEPDVFVCREHSKGEKQKGE